MNYRIALCLITRYQLPIDMQRYIEHYTNIGVTDIFVYDNESKSDIKSICDKFTNVFYTFIDEDYICKNPQHKIYTDFYNQHKNDYDYILCLDDDEYLWLNSKKYKDLHEFCNYLDKENIEQYILPWQYISYKDNERPYKRSNSMIEDCHYTYPSYFQNNKKDTCFKSIVSTKSSAVYSYVHYFTDIDGNYKLWYDDKVYYTNDIVDSHIYVDFRIADVKLFHYLQRSLEEWEIKMTGPSCDNRAYKNLKEKYIKTFKQPATISIGYTEYINPFNTNKQTNELDLSIFNNE